MTEIQNSFDGRQIDFDNLPQLSRAQTIAANLFSVIKLSVDDEHGDKTPPEWVSTIDSHDFVLRQSEQIHVPLRGGRIAGFIISEMPTLMLPSRSNGYFEPEEQCWYGLKVYQAILRNPSHAASATWADYLTAVVNANDRSEVSLHAPDTYKPLSRAKVDEAYVVSDVLARLMSQAHYEKDIRRSAAAQAASVEEQYEQHGELNGVMNIGSKTLSVFTPAIPPHRLSMN